MRAHTLPLSKNGVTGVTRVTPITRRPVSLAFTTVTQLSSLANLGCNAASTCNAKVNALALRADGLQPYLTHDFRWLRLPNAGRGTLRYTVPEALGNG